MIKNSYIKDVMVFCLALLGGLSDINWMDVPFWVYIIVFFVYVILRVLDKNIKIKDI